MRNRELSSRIKTAVEHAAPDVLDRVLSSCEEQKGNVIFMNEAQTVKRRSRFAPIAVAAALLLVCGGFGFNQWHTANAVDSVIMLDVNPSISITVNSKEKVINVTAGNDDGRIVLGDMDFKGVDLDVAVNAIIGSMLQNGYLNDIQNSILVSVENNDTQKSAQLQARVSAAIDSMFQGGSVLSQTVTEDADLAELAGRHGISLGKASLIQELVSQDATLSFEALVPLTVNEISLIAESRGLSTQTVTQTGTASDKAYIGKDAALRAAYAHAGVTAAQVAGVQTEFDSEDGVMVYEIEFWVGSAEYDYDVNARTGDIVKSERKDTNHNSGSSGNVSAGDLIGEDAAKTAALSHAGVKSSSADSMSVRLSYDDGRPEHYEVEFWVGSTKYEYEIDMYTGAVLKSEQENKGNDHDSASTSTPTGGYIGEDAAKAAALSHAGLAASQVSGLKCDLDRDDGVAVYEVEFRAGGTEYDYEIDASTGSILKSEAEQDD